MSGAWLDPAFEEQRQLRAKDEADLKALFLRRLRADPDLTLTQLRKRLGVTDGQAKKWAAAAGLAIGRAGPSLGTRRNGDLLQSIRKHSKGGR